MCLGALCRAHFVQIDVEAAVGNLPGSLAASQPAADNGDRVSHEGCSARLSE